MWSWHLTPGRWTSTPVSFCRRWVGRGHPPSEALSSRKLQLSLVPQSSHPRTPRPHLASPAWAGKAKPLVAPPKSQVQSPVSLSLPPVQGFVRLRQPSFVMKSQAHRLCLPLRGGAGGRAQGRARQSKDLFLLSEIPARSIQAPRQHNALKASAFSPGQFSFNKILKLSSESLPPGPECQAGPSELGIASRPRKYLKR